MELKLQVEFIFYIFLYCLLIIISAHDLIMTATVRVMSATETPTADARAMTFSRPVNQTQTIQCQLNEPQPTCKVQEFDVSDTARCDPPVDWSIHFTLIKKD